MPASSLRLPLALLFLLSLCLPLAQGKPVDWLELTPADFSALPEAQGPIVAKDFNADLLGAAIFHESNRRRAEHKMPVLKPLPKLAKIARRHSENMAKFGELTHLTPGDKKGETFLQRITQAKLDPQFTAENIGFDFLVRYESGREFYIRPLSGGRKGAVEFSYEPEGPALAPHTYLSWAQLIVQEWLDSPEHRKNLLSPEPQFLGTGAALQKVPGNMDRIYATQEFFTPRTAEPWE